MFKAFFGSKMIAAQIGRHLTKLTANPSNLIKINLISIKNNEKTFEI